MKEFIIPKSLADALHGYLLTQPMGDVEGLVMGLRNLQPVPVRKPVEMPQVEQPAETQKG